MRRERGASEGSSSHRPATGRRRSRSSERNGLRTSGFTAALGIKKIEPAAGKIATCPSASSTDSTNHQRRSCDPAALSDRRPSSPISSVRSAANNGRSFSLDHSALLASGKGWKLTLGDFCIKATQEDSLLCIPHCRLHRGQAKFKDYLVLQFAQRKTIRESRNLEWFHQHARSEER